MQQLMDIKPSPLDLDTPEEFKLYTFFGRNNFCSPVVYTRIQEDCSLALNGLYNKHNIRLITEQPHTVEPLLPGQSGTYHCPYLRNVRN